MDPAAQNTNNYPVTPKASSRFPKNTPKIVLLILILVAILGGFYLTKGNKNPFSALQPNQSTPAPTTDPVEMFFSGPEDKVILKVGEENIYQKDFDIELAAQPYYNTPNLKQILLDKLTSDSVILQGAKDEKLATLDSSIYNSVNKNYKKRISTVLDLKQKIASASDGISGSFVSLWFNNVTPGPAGYEKGKQIALEKMTKLYNDVKDRKITILEAANQIKNDSSLAQVDPQYKSNAILNFAVNNRSQTITFIPEFDSMLWNLNEGEITPLYTGKDKDSKTGEIKDSLYMFGTVTKKSNSGTIKSFDEWLMAKRKQYAATTY